ncbi:ParB/RepB/Spo0J family partition protein [Phytohabitans aurantiacus]|uniref:ParB-like N-terminal domain-containing protein n=1 Tax=Phytohabitans aurantiacus TaxID=3016789 RepID=A0ABQ5RBD8_9ACTN|nr:ParB/RepB/Spo0J family partition protein [Phytohabitans aurantiacus]GLI03487.1 hypothetical protein Pa4123_87650 [Phytohabitans aurantiacus]
MADQEDSSCPHRDGVVRVRIGDLAGTDTVRLDGVDEEHARALAEIDELPPILVHCGTMRVLDGAHRLRAAELRQRQEIAATFFHGTAEEAFRLAVKSNVTHGLPLTLRDRQEAAARILRSNPMLSDRAIAATTGLAGKTVGAIRARTDGAAALARLGRDGKLRPLDATEARRMAAKVLAERPTSSLQEIAREAGVSVGTARDVRARVLAGKDPASTRDRQHVTAVSRPRPPRDSPAASSLDAASVLEGLMRDPSLRYTEAGRTLLRWLGGSSSLIAANWRETLDGVPPHCAPLVGQLARECGKAWIELAYELERRGTGPAE